MNQMFGTRFDVGPSGCTKGIKFSLQKSPNHSDGANTVEWLLYLDMEGLRSLDRMDDEFDRRIVLFAMLAADVVIVYEKDKVSPWMINTLNICCQRFADVLDKVKVPKLIFTGMNTAVDFERIKAKIRDDCDSVLMFENDGSVRESEVSSNRNETIADIVEQMFENEGSFSSD
jgi:hypothetical protein